MLRQAHSLYFPRLIHLGEVSPQKRPEEDGPLIPLYRLDWAATVEHMRARHKEWQEQAQGQAIDFVWGFDEPFMSQVTQMQFALRSSYVDEVRRQTLRAVEEWGRPLPFDTQVRDWCTAPAVAHVQVAFKLLTDCIYDPETKYWSRSDELRAIAWHALAYLFWEGQTGRGLVRDHAGFDHLEWLIKEENAPRVGANVQQYVSRFLKVVDEQEARIDAMWRKRHQELKGPSIEP